MARYPAIRVADELPLSVVEVAEDVAAPRRHVVHDLARIVIARDVGGRVCDGLTLQVFDERGHRRRRLRRLACRLCAARCNPQHYEHETDLFDDY